MSSGIYCYKDMRNGGKIIYIGKDSYIGENRRHKQHLQSCRYNQQVINRVLQNNHNRYKYEVLIKGDISQKLLNGFEKAFIRRYNPKFCYTAGGDGICGWNHSEESKKKMSESHKGLPSHRYGKNLSEETKRKISESLKGRKLLEETKRKMSDATKKSMNNKLKEQISEKMTKKYGRIIKYGLHNGKQNYCIRKDRKRIKCSVYPYKLLEWFIKEYPKDILQIKINKE